jgi:hypothetical protein
MQNSDFEMLLVVDYMTEISWKSWASNSKFAEKSGIFGYIFSNNFLVLSTF